MNEVKCSNLRWNNFIYLRHGSSCFKRRSEKQISVQIRGTLVEQHEETCIMNALNDVSTVIGIGASTWGKDKVEITRAVAWPRPGRFVYSCYNWTSASKQDASTQRGSIILTRLLNLHVFKDSHFVKHGRYQRPIATPSHLSSKVSNLRKECIDRLAEWHAR